MGPWVGTCRYGWVRVDTSSHIAYVYISHECWKDPQEKLVPMFLRYLDMAIVKKKNTLVWAF